jgi:hypothetical protein
MNVVLIRDIVISGFLGGIFSYFASIYNSNPEYLKITAYLWGLPLLYFILLNISWNAGENAMLDFNKHAIIGTIITMLAMFSTYFIYHMGNDVVIGLQFVVLATSIFIYMSNELYKY